MQLCLSHRFAEPWNSSAQRALTRTAWSLRATATAASRTTQTHASASRFRCCSSRRGAGGVELSRGNGPSNATAKVALLVSKNWVSARSQSLRRFCEQAVAVAQYGASHKCSQLERSHHFRASAGHRSRNLPGVDVSRASVRIDPPVYPFLSRWHSWIEVTFRDPRSGST